MSLSFLPQSNQPGTICYLIHGGHTSDTTQARDFQKAINDRLPNKVVLIDNNSQESRELVNFFALTDLRFPIFLIVREDDSLSYEWTTTLPTVEDVLYHLHQIGD